MSSASPQPTPSSPSAEASLGEELVRAAVKKWNLPSVPIAVAESETLGPLGVNQVPATLFIGSDGIIVAAASGEKSGAFIRRRIRELLEREKKLK